MGSAMPAAYWRAYRARRRAEGRPVVAPDRNRGDRTIERAHANARRQARRRRLDVIVDVALEHPLLTAALELVPLRKPGAALRFADELADEDARSEAILAILERRDPVDAIRAYRSIELRWRLSMLPLLELRP